MVIYGSGKPPYGPVDIVVQDGLINYIGPADMSPGTSTAIPTTPRSADTVIDATGKYVMPGIVNAHMHWHEERQPGMPQPIQYERNLYLAAGRDHGARSRRRLREVEALAGREQRAHDHRAADPGLPVRQQGPHRIAGRDPRLDPRHQGARAPTA